MAPEGRHYQILSVLGRGGFGTVYRARLNTEGGFAKIVALKVLNPDVEGVTEMASRMRDEARLLAMVNHRAIVQVDALVVLDGKWTVVMEYVEGADVTSLIKHGTVPLGPALEIARELSSALDVAYRDVGPDGQPLKILHRDIKPGNIRVTTSGEVKLLDFGIARADFQAREAKTKALAFGTPDYMAPERLQFVDGPEGDVYAVGVVIYEMLTGDHFGATTLSEERHNAKVKAALDQIWQVTGGQSEDLARFIGATLAFEPEARPSARELERRCIELWRTLGQQTLRDWAETLIPTLTGTAEEAVPEDLAAKMLTENIRSGSFGYPTDQMVEGGADKAGGFPEPAPTARMATPHPISTAPPSSSSGSGGLLVAGVLAFLFFGFLVVAGGGYYFYSRSKTTTPPIGVGTVTPPVTTTTTPPDSTTTPPVTTTPPDSTTTPPVTTTTTPPVTTTTPPPVTTPPATTPPATTPPTEARHIPTGRVLVSGDATIRLLQGSTATAPGNAVKPGAYMVEATFAGEAAKNQGRVFVRAGETAQIICAHSTKTCQIRQ